MATEDDKGIVKHKRVNGQRTKDGTEMIEMKDHVVLFAIVSSRCHRFKWLWELPDRRSYSPYI